jgi:hypothetical protein
MDVRAIRPVQGDRRGRSAAAQFQLISQPEKSRGGRDVAGTRATWSQRLSGDARRQLRPLREFQEQPPHRKLIGSPWLASFTCSPRFVAVPDGGTWAFASWIRTLERALHELPPAPEEVNVRLAMGAPLRNAFRMNTRDFVGKQSRCRFSN